MIVNLKNLKNFLSLTIGCWFFANALNAQHSLGLLIGDHNAPYSYSLNPALTRSNVTNRGYINWWGSSNSFDNNFMTYAAPYKITDWYKQSTNSSAKPETDFNQDWLKVDAGKSLWNLNYLNEVYGPSIFVPIDYFGGFGFGVRGISGASVSGLGSDLGQLLRYGFTDKGMDYLKNKLGQTIQQGQFSINTEKYQEWYMSFAASANPNAVRNWRWGFTGKFLVGMSMAHVGSDSLTISVDDLQNLHFNQLNANMMYTNSQMGFNTLGSPFGLKFDVANGAGFGMDLGFMYEYRPNAGQFTGAEMPCERERFMAYKWKFGASLTDLGFINYTGSASQIVSARDQYLSIKSNTFNTLQGGISQALEDAKTNIFDNVQGQSALDFMSYSPAALNLQYDNAIANRFHFGAYLTQNLKSKNSVGLRRTSYFAMVPRWQNEKIEWGFPFTYYSDYSKWTSGAYVRVGSVIVGSDNLKGLFQFVNNSPYTGASFYFGFRSKIGSCERPLTREYVNNSTPKDSIIPQKKNNAQISANNTTTSQDSLKQKQAKIEEEKLNQKANELKKKEADLKVLEEKLKLREAEIEKLKTNPTSPCVECESKLVKLTADYNQLKLNYDAEVQEYNKCKTAVTNAQISVNKANQDLQTEKLKSQTLASEIETLKAKATTVSSNTPCESKLKQLDSLYNKEITKNSQITATVGKKTAELENTLNDLTKLKSSCADSAKKLASLSAQLTDLKNQSAIGKKCCDQLSQSQSDLANEKLKNSSLQADALKNKAQIDALTKEKTALQVENQSLKNSIKPCEDCSPFKAKILQMDATITGQTAQIEQLKLEKKACEDKIKNASGISVGEDCTPYKNKVAQLEAQVTNLNKLIADLQLQNESLKADKKACEDKLKLNSGITVGEDCTPYKNQIADLLKKNADLQASLTQSNAQNADYQKQIAQLQLDKKACEDKLKLNSGISVGEDCTPYKNQVKDLLTKNSDLSNSNTDLQKQVALLAADKKACEDKLKATSGISVSEDCTPYKKQVADLQLKLGDLQSQITKLAADKKACEDKLKNTSSISATEDCTPIKNQLAEIQQKYSSLQTDYANTKSNLDAALKTNSDLTAQLQKCKDLESKLTACNADKLKLQSDLANANSTITALQDKVNKLSAVDCSSLQAQVNTMKSDIDSKNAKIDQLTSDLQSCNSTLNDLKSAQTKCANDLATLQNTVDGLNKTVGDQNTQIANLTSQITDKTAEIARLKAQIKVLQDALKKCEDSLPKTDPGN